MELTGLVIPPHLQSACWTNTEDMETAESFCLLGSTGKDQQSRKGPQKQHLVGPVKALEQRLRCCDTSAICKEQLHAENDFPFGAQWM